MRALRMAGIIAVISTVCTAQSSAPIAFAPDTDRVINSFVAREHLLMENLQKLTPLAETYIQGLRVDNERGLIPDGDVYFLGRLGFRDGRLAEALYAKSSGGVSGFTKSFFGSMTYVPEGFAGQMLIDGNFDRRNYTFRYVGREFLGEVRCLMFDVIPGKRGQFEGRIWVEDEEFNIVRAKGRHTDSGWFQYNFHFDSWRQNVRPGLWLPAVVYTEELDLRYVAVRKARLRAITRFWNYAPFLSGRQQEKTSVLVEPDEMLQDRQPHSPDTSAWEAQEAWRREAEQNILDRLEQAGLLAPMGPLDAILETVANNLQASQEMQVAGVRCRVLLTSPLESFTVGNTIVVSRGLLDVLPDETALAVVLARELARIKLGQNVDLKYTFSDRLFFPDKEVLKRLQRRGDKVNPQAIADAATALLQGSPYRNLDGAAAFLALVRERSGALPNLTKSRIGEAWTSDSAVAARIAASSAHGRSAGGRPALPIGARVNVHPWTSEVTLSSGTAPGESRGWASLSVGPVRPDLTRHRQLNNIRVIGSTQASGANVVADRNR